jgi:hypothetical protein
VHPYAETRSVPEFLAWTRTALAPHGFQAATALPLVSVCRDELMFPFLDAVSAQWGHCFDMSSLAGLPLLGRTGIGAALGHAPGDDGRHRLVVFAFPHIGIDADGVVGSVERPGVAGSTAACGAVAVARRALVRGVSGVVLDRHDVEESLLVARLREVLGDGLVPDLVVVTELVRAAAVEELSVLLSDLNTPEVPVDYALVSGVLVHEYGGDRVVVRTATVVVDGASGSVG